MTRQASAACAFITAVWIAIVLTGCTMTSTLPPFDTVQTETHAALRKVIDHLPTSSPVEQLGEDSIGCDSAAASSETSGVTFTNHIAVVQAQDFDGEAFIAALPERLGPNFTTLDEEVDLSFPAVDIVATEHGGTLLSVSTGEDDGEKYVEIYAFSRCAQPSETSTSRDR